MIIPNFKVLIATKKCIPITNHYIAKYIDGKWYASNGKKKYLIDNWEIEETPIMTIYSRPDNKHHPNMVERTVVDINSKSLNAINGGWSKFYEGMKVNPTINDKTCII